MAVDAENIIFWISYFQIFSDLKLQEYLVPAIKLVGFSLHK